MEVPLTTRRVRTLATLDRLLDAIESGREPRPDWITLTGAARVTRLAPARMAPWLPRLHAASLRGFEAGLLPGRGAAYLERWCTLARAGFHDFAEGCWSKGYAAPFAVDFDYVTPYRTGGLSALDPYATYSAVLGTWEYTAEDFLNTELCRDVRCVVEPMAGTAEFTWWSHFRHPDLDYCMIDLDAGAEALARRRRWVEGTRRHFVLGDVLAEASWQAVRRHSPHRSLAYVGKQSQNFFDTPGLVRLMELGTRYADLLILEVSQPYLVAEEPAVDDLTRPEQAAAGLRVALADTPGRRANPLTNHLHFDLVARDRSGRRILWEYRDWIGWQAPTLTALARLLGLEAWYYHSERLEFRPVARDTETSDCRENNTFLLLRRP